ncbi:MAG: 3-keto-5-aminohexanoate cleavage protein [Halobacteriota archaeon]|nr:3-keto-5-aminohexanoate cleavage protein [Halobacteriota archaeon]
MEDDLAHPLKPYDKLIINVALTGMVPTKKDSPFVPTTVDEIIEDAIKCASVGASILHIHARDSDEAPTYKAEAYAEIIEGIRSKCPDVIICVTTSGRTYGEFEKRSEVLELRDHVKPDMASLTLGSINFPDQTSINEPETILRLAKKMKSVGIKPELEVFDTGMINTARYLYRKGVIEPPFYFNILFGSIYATQARMSDLCYLVSQLPQGSIWAGAGIGIFQLIINSASVIMGGNVRTGIEDNIWYDHEKTELTTNVKTIQRVCEIAAIIGREIATPSETRKMLGFV